MNTLILLAAISFGNMGAVNTAPVVSSNIVNWTSVANTSAVYIASCATNAYNGLWTWVPSAQAYQNTAIPNTGIAFIQANSAWELTNAGFPSATPVFDTTASANYGNLQQPTGYGWQNEVSVSYAPGMTTFFATNTVQTNVDTNVLFDNAVYMTNTEVYSMPTALSNAIVAAYWGTNTAFVDNVLGNDSTAVLGDPTHPSLTITNAYYKFAPSVIWLTAGEIFTEASNLGTGQPWIKWTNDAVIVAMGATMRGTSRNEEMFRIDSGRLEIWGGTFDAYTGGMLYSNFRWSSGIANQTNAWLFLHYCNVIGYQDCIFPLGVTNAVTYISVEKCKFFSTYDTFNGTTGNGTAIFAFYGNDCLFSVNVTGPDGITHTNSLDAWPYPQRNFNEAGNGAVPGGFHFNNCTFSSVGVLGGAGNTLVCGFLGGANNGTSNYFRNCRFLGGVNGTNQFSLVLTNTCKNTFLQSFVPWENMKTNGNTSISYAE